MGQTAALQRTFGALRLVENLVAGLEREAKDVAVTAWRRGVEHDFRAQCSWIKRRSLGKELGAATIVDPLLPRVAVHPVRVMAEAETGCRGGRVAATGASRTSNGPLVPFLLRASDLELNFHGAEFLAIGKTMCGKAGGPDGWTQLLSEAAWHDFGVRPCVCAPSHTFGDSPGSV